jgi:hypothetical protein
LQDVDRGTAKFEPWEVVLQWLSRGRHVHQQHACSRRALAYVGRGPASAVRRRGASWGHRAALGAGGAAG